MDVLRGLDFCCAYLDGILFSRSLEEHELYLRVLLDRFQTYGILMNPAKCVFSESDVIMGSPRVPDR
jgi:hypothetical protein